MLTFRQFFEASDMDDSEEPVKKKKDGRKKVKDNDRDEPVGGETVPVAISDKGRKPGA